jgi:hypothetical protein
MHGFIGLLMLIPSLLQPPPGAQPFVGTWTVELNGTTFIRLDIQMTNDTLTGRIGVGDMHVDANGHADRVAAAPRDSTPIVIEDLDVTRSKLTFSRKDGDDTDHFTAQLIDPTSLELSFLLTDADRREFSANGIHLPEPVLLKRVTTGRWASGHPPMR